MEGEVLPENVKVGSGHRVPVGVVVVVEREVGRTVGEGHKSCCSLFR